MTRRAWAFLVLGALMIVSVLLWGCEEAPPAKLANGCPAPVPTPHWYVVVVFFAALAVARWAVVEFVAFVWRNLSWDGTQ